MDEWSEDSMRRLPPMMLQDVMADVKDPPGICNLMVSMHQTLNDPAVQVRLSLSLPLSMPLSLSLSLYLHCTPSTVCPQLFALNCSPSTVNPQLN